MAGARCAEVAGGTAADCAAVWCCCPCGVAKFLVFAVVSVPLGLCRRAIGWKRRRSPVVASAAVAAEGESRKEAEAGVLLAKRAAEDEGGVEIRRKEEAAAAMEEMEKEMWERFYLYSAGFWRSSSRREERESRDF